MRISKSRHSTLNFDSKAITLRKKHRNPPKYQETKRLPILKAYGREQHSITLNSKDAEKILVKVFDEKLRRFETIPIMNVFDRRYRPLIDRISRTFPLPQALWDRYRRKGWPSLRSTRKS